MLNLKSIAQSVLIHILLSTAKRRGVDINSKSRPLNPEDIGRFDYIIAMDAKNIAAMKVAIEYWKPNASIPKNYEKKFSMMTSYCRESEGVNEVPDPYYGGPQGFETVLDLLDDACSGLLGKIKADDPEKF